MKNDSRLWQAHGSIHMSRNKMLLKILEKQSKEALKTNQNIKAHTFNATRGVYITDVAIHFVICSLISHSVESRGCSTLSKTLTR